MRVSSGSAQRPLVSVLTPTIPSRAALLEECRLSVLVQTFGGWEHLVLLDSTRRGCSETMNELARKAQGEWLVPLADDDLILPGCLATLVAAAERTGADVVYAPPLVWNAPHRGFWQEPPCIPSFALVRKRLWDDLGGYDEDVVREEDRGLWTRALEAGAKFERTDAGPCWVYRFAAAPGHMNKSLNGGVAA